MTLLRCVIAQILWAFYAIGEVPVCEQPPDVDFGNIISDEKLQYVESDTVQYGCNPGYTLAGSQRIKCDGRNWTPPPKCLAPCTITKQQLEEKKLLLPSGRRRTLMIQTDQVVEFSCSEGYVLMVPSNRKCFDGHMDFPLCISETGKKCGRPPVVANGDMTTFAQKEYASGSLVEYTCQKFYSLKGQNKSFCDNGNWIEIPVCEDPCIISQEEMQNHGIELTEAYNGTQYVQYHDFVVFNCKSGHIPQALLSISNFTVQCNSGNIAYPHCNKDELGRCGPAPSIQNGDIISEQLPVYAAGSSVEYKCQRFHGMTGSKTITCRLGKWTAPPICSEIRCDSPTVTNGTYHPLRRVFREEDTISVTCNAGFHFDTNNRNNISECTKTGWIPFPRCTRRPCDYPHIENGALSRTYEYYREQMFPATLGRTIHYQCDQGYTPKTNERYSICTKEGWDPKPQCLKICDTNYLANGHFLLRYWRYKEDDEISYECWRDYRPENPEAKAVCTKNNWMPPPRCIYKTAAPGSAGCTTPSGTATRTRASRRTRNLKDYQRQHLQLLEHKLRTQNLWVQEDLWLWQRNLKALEVQGHALRGHLQTLVDRFLPSPAPAPVAAPALAPPHTSAPPPASSAPLLPHPLHPLPPTTPTPAVLQERRAKRTPNPELSLPFLACLPLLGPSSQVSPFLLPPTFLPPPTPVM
ncbi:complement factor H-like isoform X4 [Pelodiscus sinensis]|uniref:complement factor H-like isoform X4 n=1 Tax=Pelodiscus sinensis TaxID=13735 RepID=UPI003F6C3DAF